MNKKQYADMLKDICETHKSGGDVSACIAKYNELYKYVYVYNDAVIKLLLGNPENEAITVDFLNAALHLYGSDCIDHLTFENLERPVPVPAGSLLALLQEKAELSKFTEEFLVSEAMKMSDREYELYVEKKLARAEGREEGRAEERLDMAKAMLAEGDSVEKVARIVKLPEADVLAIQAKLAAHNI